MSARVEAEDDIGRGEQRSVVEADALAKPEIPGHRVDKPPCFRKMRLPARLALKSNRALLVDLIELGLSRRLVERACGSKVEAPPALAQRSTFSAAAGAGVAVATTSAQMTGHVSKELDHWASPIGRGIGPKPIAERVIAGDLRGRAVSGYSRTMLGSQIASSGTADDQQLPRRPGRRGPSAHGDRGRGTAHQRGAGAEIGGHAERADERRTSRRARSASATQAMSTAARTTSMVSASLSRPSAGDAAEVDDRRQEREVIHDDLGVAERVSARPARNIRPWAASVRETPTAAAAGARHICQASSSR